MAEKKDEFVVSDRRRFAPEGELRSDVTTEAEEEKPATTAAPPTASAPPAESKDSAPAEPPEAAETAEEMPPPPSAQEQQEQKDAYKASSKKLDDMVNQAAPGRARMPAEMTFERLIESFYVTALLQLGAYPAEGGEQPPLDIMGARQTIDSLTLLQEKTKGNLTEREQHFLQNLLFQLRMLWIEVTNAIASGAAGGPGAAGPGGGIKK